MGSRFPDAGVSQSPDTVIVPDHGIRTLGSFGRNYGLGHHGMDHETPAKLTLCKGSQYYFTHRRLESNHRKSSPRFRKGLSSCIDICGRDVAKIDVLSFVVRVDPKFFRFQRPSGEKLHAPADSALENADCTNLSTIL